MRDLFDDLKAGEPESPVALAQRAMRSQLRRRFYEQVTVAECEGRFDVLLDGRPVRTPARNPLGTPTPALSEAVAAEWRAQTEVVDPGTMPLTRLVNTIIDGVATSAPAVAEDVAKFLASDLVVYRAEGPEGLVERQAAAWDPVLAWARDTLGARFVAAAGMIYVTQPEAALAAARAAIPHDIWRLGAVHTITTLTGSALIALAVLHGQLDADAAWTAAHVDEDWNMDFWGRDELALNRRALRYAELQAACQVLALI
jgi:chaperone required for assembly of F1-ATPase